MVGVALLVAGFPSFYGCGSSSEDTTSGISLKRFLAEGNAVCKAAKQEQAQRFAKGQKRYPPGEPITAEQRNNVLTWIFVKPYEKQITELETLGAPKGDGKRLDAIIQAMEEAQKKVEANPTEVLTTTAMYKEANALLTKYGLKSCVV